MSRKYKFRDSDGLYFVSFAAVYWIDVFIRREYKDILRDFKSYTSSQLKKAIKENISESRREWMLWMMGRAGQKNSNNIDFQFWQQHNQPIELFTKEVLQQKLEYLHRNPVFEGYVEQAEEYLYSSAKDYAGIKGLLELYMIE